ESSAELPLLPRPSSTRRAGLPILPREPRSRRAGAAFRRSHARIRRASIRPAATLPASLAGRQRRPLERELGARPHAGRDTALLLRAALAPRGIFRLSRDEAREATRRPDPDARAHLH